MKRAIFAALVAVFATSQVFAGIRVELPPPVAMSGTGATITIDFVTDDQVLVTVKPTDPAEIAHYGIAIGFNPAEYRFVEARGVSVSRAENGRVVLASSYVLNGPNTEDMGVVLRRTSPEWGRLEPQEGLRMVARNGEWRIFEPAPAFTPNPSALPHELTLWQNYPNPFNPSTEIRFSVAGDGPAQLAIYNMVGQKVRTLLSGQLAAGNYVVAWDATDNAGQAVSAGVYFYKLNADGQTAIRKMILLK